MKFIAWYIRLFGETFDCLNSQMGNCKLFQVYFTVYSQNFAYVKVGNNTLWTMRFNRKYWFSKLIQINNTPAVG